MKKTITLLGSNVHYWVFNPGKPQTIIMIHGFRGTHHGLQYIIAHLPDYTVVVPDLPGFGASTPMTERKHSITGYRDFTEAFIKSLALKKKPALLGHSFGSIVVAATAARTPQLISKLIVVNPIAAPARNANLAWLAEVYYWLGHRLPERAGRALLSNPLIVRFMTVMLTRTREPHLRKLIHHNHLTYFSTFQTRAALTQAFQASMTHTVTEFAMRIPVPTLQIVGEQDNVAPMLGQRDLARKLPHGALVVLSRVGHLVHYEKPDEAAAAIKKFLH